MSDYQVGDKGIILNEGSDFQAYIPYTKPNIGDKAYIYTMRNGMKIAIPVLEFEIGNPMWMSPDMPMAGFDWKVDFNFNLIPLGIPLPCVSTLTGVADEVVEDTKKAWANDELIGKQLFMLSGARKDIKFPIVDNTENTCTVSTFGNIIKGGDFESDTDAWIGGTNSGPPRESVLTTEASHSSSHSWKLAMNTYSFYGAYVYQNGIDLTGVSEISFYIYGYAVGGSAAFVAVGISSGDNMTGGMPATANTSLPTTGWKKVTYLINPSYQCPGICLYFYLYNNGVAYIDDVHIAATGTGVAVGDRYVIWDPVELRPYCGYASRLTGIGSSYVEDGYRSWSTDEIADYQIEMLTGPNGGSRFNITSNTRTKITLSSTAGFEIGNWYKIWDPVNSCYIPIG
jgi:hypothetical protein